MDLETTRVVAAVLICILAFIAWIIGVAWLQDADGEGVDYEAQDMAWRELDRRRLDKD